MGDIADHALMDCVDKLDARKLKGNFSFGLDFLQETVETRFTHVSNKKEIKTRMESPTAQNNWAVNIWDEWAAWRNKLDDFEWH